MTKSTHGGKRKGAGRTQEFGAAKSVRLTDEHIRIARQLGQGDVSAGIRLALEMAAKNKSKNSEK